MSSFETNLQKWVLIDNQMKVMNDKMKQLREQKTEVYKNIEEHVSKNQLSNATVKITDGQLKFVNTKVTSPLTYKYLEKSLGEIIRNETQVNQIMNYLKEKREYKIVPEIKRTYL